MKRHPYFLAFLSGICATLTLPPIYLFPLVIPAYGGLFYLLAKADTRRRAALTGFFWGWGFYMTGLYWFVIALMTDPDKFAWLIPLALFALTAVIALYTAVFAWLWQQVKKSGVKGALIFSLLWTLVELARGHLFTGFPWNLAGYVFNATDASIQLASLIGIYGLTFVAVFLGAVTIAHRRAAIACWVILALGIGWGQWRVTTAPEEYVDGVKLRLVQANISQHHKWDPNRQMQGLRAHISIMRAPGIETITHVIWPETAVPYVLNDDSTLALRLGETLLPGQYLITGAIRGNSERLTNSIAVVDSKGAVQGSYDKYKLVPFGEFLPLRWMIPDALETPVGMMDMTPGPGAQTLRWPGLPPVSPLICYEVIFPGNAVKENDRPSWLLSVTNDAWFGTSSAPYQHLAMARMRAIEQGLPMVRAANTGISAVFDSYGRRIAYLPLNTADYADTKLPKPSQNETLFTKIFMNFL